MTKHICLTALFLLLVFSPTPLMAYPVERFSAISALVEDEALIYECGLLKGKTGKPSFAIESATSVGTSYYFDGTAGDDSRDGLSQDGEMFDFIYLCLKLCINKTLSKHD